MVHGYRAGVSAAVGEAFIQGIGPAAATTETCPGMLGIDGKGRAMGKRLLTGKVENVVHLVDGYARGGTV
jgi:hypothetical protein